MITPISRTGSCTPPGWTPVIRWSRSSIAPAPRCEPSAPSSRQAPTSKSISPESSRGMTWDSSDPDGVWISQGAWSACPSFQRELRVRLTPRTPRRTRGGRGDGGSRVSSAPSCSRGDARGRGCSDGVRGRATGSGGSQAPSEQMTLGPPSALKGASSPGGQEAHSPSADRAAAAHPPMAWEARRRNAVRRGGGGPGPRSLPRAASLLPAQQAVQVEPVTCLMGGVGGRLLLRRKRNPADFGMGGARRPRRRPREWPTALSRVPFGAQLLVGFATAPSTRFPAPPVVTRNGRRRSPRPSRTRSGSPATSMRAEGSQAP